MQLVTWLAAATIGLALALLPAPSADDAKKPAPAADDESAAEERMAKLKDIQEIVGTWEGSGSGEAVKGKGFDEGIDCTWKFRKDGKVSLYLTFKEKEGKEKESGARLLDEAALTYDAERELYVLRAYRHNAGEEAEPLVFEGKPKTRTNLVLDRVLGKGKKESGDGLDRIDLKILNDGDRIVYSFHRRIGESKRYRAIAQVALDRKGTSLAASAASGPKCIVTAGAGIMTVSYQGKTYYVCCTGCREMFNDAPEKYIARAEKAAKKP
jgi:YHS domain-containing protein